VKNAEVQQRTSVSDFLVVAQTRKWKWEGHVARTDQRRWAHATRMWDVIIGKGELSDGSSDRLRQEAIALMELIRFI